jgi:hypothetical protein
VAFAIAVSAELREDGSPLAMHIGRYKYYSAYAFRSTN